MDSLVECLYRLAVLHKQPCTRDSIVQGLPMTEGKLEVTALKRAARNAQLDCQLLETSLSNINQRLLPVLVLLRSGSACLLMKLDIKANKAWVIYPELSQAVTEQSIEQFEQDYTGHVAYVRPHFRFEQRTTKPDSNKRHWFWHAFRPNLGLYRDVLIAAFLVNLFALIMPLFVMNVYDRVVPNKAFDTLWILASGVALVFVLDFTLRNIRTWLIDKAAIHSDKVLSARMMQSILGMKLEAKSQSSGNIAATLQQYEFIRTVFSSSMVTLLVDLPYILLFAVIIALISPLLLMPILIGGTVLLIASLWTRFRLGSNAQLSAQTSALRNSNLIEGLVNLEQLKAFNHQGKMQQQWESSSQYLAELNARNKFHAGMLQNTAQLTQHLVGVSIIILGVYLLADGNLSQGGIIATYLISSRIMGPLNQLTGLLIQWQHASTAYRNIEQLVNAPQEQQLHQQVQSSSLQGSIEFKHVSFQYPGQQHSLKNVSLRIQSGEKIAVLGRNGSGKSTLIKLLLGLYQPSDGHIFFDNIDSQQLSVSDVRKQIGYVPQEPLLFFGTLADNIKINHPLASNDALRRACQLSHLDDLVNQSSSGFEFNVGERGERLSGGQKQAVALARALINGPNILLMDEPTSAMDHSHEEAIKQQLNTFCVERTLLLVTHRTALLDLVDRIIVIDQGTIVADGPKAQVIEALKHGRIGKAI